MVPARHCRSSRTDILTIMGAEFLATIFIGCLNACLVQPVAYVERTVFYRERAAGACTPPHLSLDAAALQT